MTDTNLSGPRIPASTNFTSNYTKDLETSSIFCSSITDGTATLSNGTLGGLNDPVHNQDAANKRYTDSVLHTVADPNNSVQYNNAGSFGGSTSLTFSQDTNVLYSYNTIVGTSPNMLVINAGSIYNVGSPASTTNNAISKSYIDKYFQLNIFTSSEPALVYPVSYMMNSIIVRDTTTGSDSTASATDIINYASSSFGALSDASFKFSLKNAHTEDTLSLIPGTGVSIYPTTSTLNIYAGYELDAIVKTNLSSSTANLLVTGLSWLPSTDSGVISNNNFIVGPRSMYTSANVTRVSNKMNINTGIIEITEQNFIYTAEYLTSVIHRNFNGAKIDTFGEVTSFISSYSSLNSPIYYIFTTGAVEFVVKNTSTSGSLSFESNAYWTMDPNSNMTIPIGKTGYFYVYIDATNLQGHRSEG